MSKSKMDILICAVIVVCLVSGIWVLVVGYTGLRVPAFGVGYVVSNEQTGDAYQLRGRESFRIEDSTIEFIPCAAGVSLRGNGNWTLRSGLLEKE